MNGQRSKKWEYSLWAIFAVICCCAPLLAFVWYNEGRNYDFWGTPFAIFTFMFYATIIITAISIFALVVRKSIKNKKIYAYLFLAIALALTASSCTYLVGKHIWRNELGENKKIAQNIVTLLEAYKTEHGAYPDSLDQIGKGGLLLPRGDYKEELEYKKHEGHFGLSFHYGWYDRVYRSKTGEWWWVD